MQHRPWKKSGFQSTTLIAVVVFVVILFISVGYFFVIPSLNETREDEKLLADIQMHQEIWQSNRPWSYRYVVQRDCACPDDYKKPYAAIHFGDSLTAQYLELSDTEGLEAEGTPPEPIGVDDLFALAADVVAGPGTVEVTFDPRFHYPSTLKFSRPDRNTGGNLTISIRDFEVIEYD